MRKENRVGLVVMTSSVPMVFCACGCGQLRPMYDKKGRKRKYINGHGGIETLIKKGQHLSVATELKKGRKATNKKDIPQRELIRLYWFEEKNEEEIANIFDTTIPTISHRMRGYNIPTRDFKFKKGERTGKTFEELYGEEKAKEMKVKLSKAHSGENNHFYGKTPWNKGKKWPSDVVYKMLLRRTPNNEEKFLIAFFQEYTIPYKFVGDGKVIIDNRNPDFINTDGQKKIIEFFGEHWHKSEDEEIKREIYKRYGFDLLVIWGKDLKDKNTLLSKVLDFEERKNDR